MIYEVRRLLLLGVLVTFLEPRASCAQERPLVGTGKVLAEPIVLDLDTALKAICCRDSKAHCRWCCSPCSGSCQSKAPLLAAQHAARTVFIRAWLNRSQRESSAHSSAAFARGISAAQAHVANGTSGQSDVSTFTLWRATSDFEIRNKDNELAGIAMSLIPLINAPTNSVVQLEVPSYPSSFDYELSDLLARVDCCNPEVCRQAALLRCRQSNLCAAQARIFPLRHRVRNQIYANLSASIRDAAGQLAAVRAEMKLDVRANFDRVMFIDSELTGLRALLTEIDANSDLLETAYGDNPASLSQVGTLVKDRQGHSTVIASLIAERETCISEILQFCGIVQSCYPTDKLTSLAPFTH